LYLEQFFGPLRVRDKAQWAKSPKKQSV